MSIFDKKGVFLFPNNGNSTGEAEKQEEKEHQEKVLELMQMYQQYHGRIQEKQYALRGSILACEYGTKYAQFDCVEDHGIIKNKHPIFTAIDCLRENIHNFGSCLCPETSYKERLPMTVAVDPNGKVAKKAEGNDFPHICIPLIDEEHGWLQTEKRVMVQIDEQEYAQMLMSSAVLVCQYGGIIGILEVPDVEETEQTVTELSDDEIILVSTIYGEACGCSEASWKAIANVIMNRVGAHEWSEYTKAIDIVKNTGFDAYKKRTPQYIEAEKYLLIRDLSDENKEENELIENMIQIVIPIFRGREEDITGGCVLYYSPEAQKRLHIKFPNEYGEVPNWDFEKLEEIHINGTENDDFKFYIYKEG